MTRRSSALLGLGCAASLAFSAACSSPSPSAGSGSSSTSTAAPQAVPASDVRRIADDLPLLPNGITMGARPVGVIRATYEFAARHPEVLNYMPCFCGCERGGHGSNHDCYIGKRDANGNVTEWDSHAIGCEVCIDVAEVAMQMHNSGASVTAIRDAIDKRYAGGAHGHTPTPMPKRGGETPQ